MSGTAIVRVLPTPASAGAVLCYCYGQRKGDTVERKAEIVAIEGHVEGGVLTGDARVDGEAFASRCPPGRRAVGHAVISAEKDGPAIEKKLLKSGHQWAERFAPGRGYVVIVHKKDKERRHPHCHVIFERYGPQGTAVHFSRRDLKEMVGMKFTSEFQPVRPDGSPSLHRGAAAVYPHAKRLAAREVAELLLKGETWESLLAKKVITPCRVKDGEVASFLYQEKRIRRATVEKLVASERKRRAAAQARQVSRELGEQAKKMMGKGIGDMFNELGQVAQGDPVPTPRGRRAR